ncbi:hypothetical protein [Undibacterium seohonense]|uniref:hypothetical protein n=1 Tax=Undibacterium seohonense TaxID=1344950 RepID=UPI001FE7E68F|nr:hypothetical protein [Undibacterium seohonense]
MSSKNQNKPMGFWMCTALIIGNVIGMGIFMLPASLAPYGMNAFIGWAVTLFGCIFVAHVFANFLPGHFLRPTAPMPIPESRLVMFSPSLFCGVIGCRYVSPTRHWRSVSLAI